MVYLTPYLFGISTMELPTSKFANYAYTWHRLCKPPKRTLASSTSQWLFFLFHSLQNIYISKTNISHHILINHSHRHRSMYLPLNKYWQQQVPQQWRLYISSIHQCFNTNIISFTSTATNKSISKSKISHDSRRGTIIHFQLTQRSQYLPSRSPNQIKIGKLGLISPRNCVLNHPTIPLLFYYAQNWCPVDWDEYWTLDQIIIMLKRGPHVSAKYPEATRQLHEETLQK